MTFHIIGEFSGRVRDALFANGDHAISYDLEDTETTGWHIRGDVRETLREGLQFSDTVIAFPPCTYLARSGARYWHVREKEQQEAIEFVRWIWELPVSRVCIENPIGILSSAFKKPSQIVQPWQYGHGETKATCLWLRGLPLLKPTNIVEGRANTIANMPQRKSRSKDRSRTYPGIAAAMAAQWGSPVEAQLPSSGHEAPPAP